jgi:hypothetical protein
LQYTPNRLWCLNIRGGGQGTPVDVAPCNRATAQLWWPENFTVTVQSAITGGSNPLTAITGLCLDDYADATTGRVDSWPCNGSNAQIWQFTPQEIIANVNQSILEAGVPTPTVPGVFDTALLGSVSMATSLNGPGRTVLELGVQPLRRGRPAPQ